MIKENQSADAGFHPGELAVQRQAGVSQDASRMSRMLEPVELSSGIAGFLADRTFLVITGRDAGGRLWTSPVVGSAGFLDVRSATTLAVHAERPAGDPLHAIAAGQKLGMTAVEFVTRRRVRINGTVVTSARELLVIEVEQAYGNCPQYIQQRVLARDDLGSSLSEAVRHGTELTASDVDLIRSADTFFLGTVNPERGADASHRGGPPGFVRVDAGGLWWPDYPGNNMFNSFGNLAVDPEAALLFFDFPTGRTLHLSGTTQIEWGDVGRPGDDGHTGRIARFTLERLVAGRLLGAHEIKQLPYPRN